MDIFLLLLLIVIIISISTGSSRGSSSFCYCCCVVLMAVIGYLSFLVFHIQSLTTPIELIYFQCFCCYYFCSHLFQTTLQHQNAAITYKTTSTTIISTAIVTTVHLLLLLSSMQPKLLRLPLFAGCSIGIARYPCKRQLKVTRRPLQGPPTLVCTQFSIIIAVRM